MLVTVVSEKNVLVQRRKKIGFDQESHGIFWAKKNGFSPGGFLLGSTLSAAQVVNPMDTLDLRNTCGFCIAKVC